MKVNGPDAVVGFLEANVFIEQGIGYSDTVDEVVRVQAARWHSLDWAGWALTLSTGIALAGSLAVRVPEASATGSAARRIGGVAE